jgi:Carboxypeptidase regulatory-like domain
MIVIQAATLTLLMFLVLHPEKPCSCKKVEPWEKAQGGWRYPPIIEKKTRKSIHGQVHNSNGRPLAGVFVEVFDNPAARLESGVDIGDLAKKQKRVAVCKTVEDGRFCFSGVPSGTYELRYTKDMSFETKSVIVTVGRNQDASTKDISVLLELSH